MVVAVAKGQAEAARRGRLEPVEAHLPVGDDRRERLLDALALAVDVERREVARAGDDAEDADRAVDHRWRRQRAGLEQAHDRGAPLAGEEPGPLVEELPRDAQQRRGGGERQRHAGAVPVGLGPRRARPGRPSPTSPLSNASASEPPRRSASIDRPLRRRRRRHASLPAPAAARRVVPFWASRSTVCSRSSALSGTVNTPAAVRPGGVGGAHVVGLVRPWCERHPEVLVDVGGHPHMR